MTLVEQPVVSLPMGAVPSGDPNEWSMWDNEYRVIRGPEVHIADSKVWVEASAVQYVDGRIQERGSDKRQQSGPSVSVQSHWEDYLTSDQARDLSKVIADAANLVDRWHSPGKHACPFSWCSTPAWHGEESAGEHWGVIYVVTDSLRRDDPYGRERDKESLKVGVGVKYDVGELPTVVMHFDGGIQDYDADVFLRIDEAIQVREELDRAIGGASEALQHLVASMTCAEIGGAK